MYYRARYYNPSIGRFVSEDPPGFKYDLNLYRYVHNDPVALIDPTGWDCQVCLDDYIANTKDCLDRFDTEYEVCEDPDEWDPDRCHRRGVRRKVRCDMASDIMFRRCLDIKGCSLNVPRGGPPMPPVPPEFAPPPKGPRPERPRREG